MHKIILFIAVLNIKTLKRTPRSESGGFCSGCAPPPSRSLAPQNRRTQSPRLKFEPVTQAQSLRFA